MEKKNSLIWNKSDKIDEVQQMLMGPTSVQIALELFIPSLSRKHISKTGCQTDVLCSIHPFIIFSTLSVRVTGELQPIHTVYGQWSGM